MYNHKAEKFGKFSKYTLQNEATGNAFSIVPECGACVLEVILDGQSIIDGHKTADDLLKNDWYKSACLFPFPNRLKQGKYIFEGKTYRFPINDKANQNALHGFGTNEYFKIINIDCTEKEAEIHCRHQNKGSHPAYPFAFSFDVKMIIADPGSLSLEFIFKNEDQQKIPVGLGWHPYFNCFEKAEQVFLQMPDCQIVETDEFGIPTNERFDYHYFQKKKKIGMVVLDNAFYLKNQQNRAEVRLFSEFGKLTYWQETGPQKFNYLQIFTPWHRRSIAIEPMTCNIDAFNNGDGLIVLNPGEQFSCQFGFSFEAGRNSL